MKQLSLQSSAFKYVEKGFGEWLDVLGYAPSTVYNLPNHAREMLHHFEQQGHRYLNQITTKRIKEYYQTLKTRANTRRGGGLSNAYLNKHLQALIKFTEYLNHSGKLQIAPMQIGWEEKQEKTITVLTVEEIRQLYAATQLEETGLKSDCFNARDRAMLTVFYGCGLRRNEGHHLNISDINFDRGILHVKKGKNYRERFVPFNNTNLKYLQEYVYDVRPLLTKDEKGDAFFISERGTRLQGQSMALRLQQLINRTDNIKLQEKEVTLHTLRHSIATHFLHGGMKLEAISQFLGHTSLESTQIYTHL